MSKVMAAIQDEDGFRTRGDFVKALRAHRKALDKENREAIPDFDGTNERNGPGRRRFAWAVETPLIMALLHRDLEWTDLSNLGDVVDTEMVEVVRNVGCELFGGEGGAGSSGDDWGCSAAQACFSVRGSGDAGGGGWALPARWCRWPLHCAMGAAVAAQAACACRPFVVQWGQPLQ